MGSIGDYSCSLMNERWEQLENFAKGNEGKVVGFDNCPNTGICLTNVLLAIIMASTTLMNRVLYLEDFCPNDLHGQLDDIRKRLCNPHHKIKSSNIVLSNVLTKGICETFNGRKFNSTYGVVGEYLILKYYIMNVEKKELKTPIEPLPWEQMIFETKDCDIRDCKRLDNLIQDLLGLPFQRIDDRGMLFSWYPEIKLLNFEIVVTKFKTGPFDARPFLPLYQYVYETELKQLDRLLRREQANPKVVFLGFTGSTALRLHPKFFHDFIRQLNNSYHDYMNGENEPNSFNISFYYYPQEMSVPKVNKIKNKYPLIVNGAIKYYNLIAISMRLTEERKADVQLLERPIVSRNLEVCVSEMMNYTQHLLKDKRNDELRHYLENVVQTVKMDFMKICNFLLTPANAESYYYDRPVKLHAIALILRNGQWMMMSDQFSTIIEDIEQFSTFLKDESITGVLLEDN
ncbi:hypothetical protein SNEBB_005421 [Seison nebaliae]|nr:hypothetical protein SNEBB_005421 [Seison nebaliae]